MHFADYLKFAFLKIKNKKANEHFMLSNPDNKMPPDYMMFESFQIDYKKYYEDGKESAKWILEKIEKYTALNNIALLDWGCGPARLTRHLPDLLDPSSRVYGTDYNDKTIDWCKKNLPKIDFVSNSIHPPLSFHSNSFDIVIGLSIFTHLSEENHFAWIKELHRVSKSGGILFITTHGTSFKTKMTSDEIKKYDSDNLVVRGNAKEGHRVFAAFQPESFMKNLVMPYFEILDHYEGKKMDWGIEQDHWILKKKSGL